MSAFQPPIRWRHLGGIVVVAAIAMPAHAQVSAIRIDYVRTETHMASGDVTVIEWGSRYLSEDGFWKRVDSFRGGVPTSKIVRPDRRDPDGYAAQRVELNHTLQEATIDATRYYRTVGSPAPELLSADKRSKYDTEQSTRLAERTIGPLTLTGFRLVDGPFENEIWHVSGAPMTILVEELRRDTRGEISDDLRVTAVARVTVDESLFDVPASYRVRNREPWLLR